MRLLSAFLSAACLVASSAQIANAVYDPTFQCKTVGLSGPKDGVEALELELNVTVAFTKAHVGNDGCFPAWLKLGEDRQVSGCIPFFTDVFGEPQNENIVNRLDKETYAWIIETSGSEEPITLTIDCSDITGANQ